MVKNLRHSTIQNYKNYFITENLCPENRQAFNKLYKLIKNGEIYNVWTYNGGICMKFSEREESLPVDHVDDIDYYINERNNRFSE